MLLKLEELERYVIIGSGVLFFCSVLYKQLRRYFLKKKMKRTSLGKIDRMTGYEFENYLCQLFEAKDYKIRHIGQSGDFGGDLIIRKGNKNEIIQAKRWNSKVGVKAVQEVFAAKKYYNAKTCAVMTNSYFTTQAKTLAKSLDVRLIDRTELLKYIKSI